jgi:NADPH:quinone reductase-like Zn-dependent oxidoreductase
MTRTYKALSVVLVMIVVTLSSPALVLSHESPWGVARLVPSNTQKEDFTQGSLRYDLIVDTVGLTRCRSIGGCYPQGALVIVGDPSDGRWLGLLSSCIEAMLVAPFVSQKLIFVLSELKQVDLGVLRDLLQTGKLTPVIDRRYKLRKTAAAS